MSENCSEDVHAALALFAGKISLSLLGPAWQLRVVLQGDQLTTMTHMQTVETVSAC